MNKNMYSLMLSENVVSAIDALAAAAGTNRSALINSILAEYVSYRTPEMRMRELFDMMESMIKRGGGPQALLRSSDSLFSLRSPLAYKYNPVMHYSIELYRAATKDIGELRASLRTQNSSLRLYMLQFYKLWSSIERAYAGERECSIEGERYTRVLTLPKCGELSEEQLAGGIAAYVNAFDLGLKTFFASLEDGELAVKRVEKIYRDYYRSCPAAL